jgi:hypothetical protein
VLYRKVIEVYLLRHGHTLIRYIHIPCGLHYRLRGQLLVRDILTLLQGRVAKRLEASINIVEIPIKRHPVQVSLGAAVGARRRTVQSTIGNDDVLVV